MALPLISGPYSLLAAALKGLPEPSYRRSINVLDSANSADLALASPLPPLDATPLNPRHRKQGLSSGGTDPEPDAQNERVKALESKLAEKDSKEDELFRKLEAMQKQLVAVAAAGPVASAQTGDGGGVMMLDCSGTRASNRGAGRCVLTDTVEELVRQMAEVMARLGALESIKLAPKVPQVGAQFGQSPNVLY